MTEPDFELQTVDSCPICEASEYASVGKKRTIHPSSSLEVEVRECGRCAHWFTSPAPPQQALSALYEKGSEFVVTSGWQGKKTSLSIIETFVAEEELANAPAPSRDGPKTYLEVGVGDGVLLRRFVDAGWSCTAVDPGPAPEWTHGSAVRFVSHLGEIPDASATVLVMADVLEHVVDPVAMLKKAARLTSGNIYLSFPNRASLRARIGGVHWRMVRPLGHLHYFSGRSLDTLLTRAGLLPSRVWKTDLGRFPQRLSARLPLDLGIYGLQLCLQSRLGDQWVIKANGKND